jgi:hypothetical protein
MMDFLNYIDNNNQQMSKLNKEKKTKNSKSIISNDLLLLTNIERNSMEIMRKN